MGQQRGVNGRRKGTPGERGAAAVELALVTPLLLLLVFGIIQYGLYFWAMHGGSAAARDAARRAAVGDLPSCVDFRDHVRNGIGRYGDGATAIITRTYAKGPGNALPGVQVGDVVQVSVSFTSTDLRIPLVPFIADGRVTETTDSRVEYVPTAPEACS